MVVGGCDVGSATGEAVVMKDGAILAHTIVPSTTRPELTARKAMGGKVISLEEGGRVLGFAMNNRCAAGTALLATDRMSTRS